MKIKVVWFVLFLAIVSLLIFQHIWLYNTYIFKRGELEKLTNTVLFESIEKELIYRFEKNEIGDEFEIVDKETADNDPTYKDLKTHEFSNREIIEAGLFQSVLHSAGYTFNITTLDSIFNDELKNADLPLNFHLCYKDSTGTIIDQIGNLPQSNIDKAFKTESLLIVDGKRVQAFVNITPSTVFQQMLALLIASFIMLVIIIFCVFYQTKSIFDEIKLSRLRQDFSRALTHDMKTPLSTIKSVLENFTSGFYKDKPEIQEKHGKIAMDQTESLLLLVDRILTISLMEEGKYTINRKITDMHIIIKELVERFSVWKNKTISIHSSVDIEENKIIFIDGELIKNAINNLIENAIKYSKDSVEININCYISDDNLYITVRDNGFGISEKNKEKIFEKFEREATVRKKGIIGFGVGLNYVKLVTNLHEGLIEVYSNEGEYSEFSIIIPLSKQGYVNEEDNI